MSASYVTLRPHSNTNPTDLHRVVDYDTWRDYVSGDASSYPVACEHVTADGADGAMRKLNKADGDCARPNDCRYPRCTC